MFIVFGFDEFYPEIKGKCKNSWPCPIYIYINMRLAHLEQYIYIYLTKLSLQAMPYGIFAVAHTLLKITPYCMPMLKL